MIRFALFILSLLIPLNAYAGDYPAIFKVTGVASDDVLNVRSIPGASGALLGSLVHDATGIQVTGTDDENRWGRINLGEISGWVSLRYLVRTSPDWNGDLPLPLNCGGTEPFWSADVNAARAVFEVFDDGKQALPIDDVIRSSGYTNRFGIAGAGFTAVVAQGYCSDGMSDRAYGLSIDLILGGPGQRALYSGCCALSE